MYRISVPVDTYKKKGLHFYPYHFRQIFNGSFAAVNIIKYEYVMLNSEMGNYINFVENYFLLYKVENVSYVFFSFKDVCVCVLVSTCVYEYIMFELNLHICRYTYNETTS